MKIFCIIPAYNEEKNIKKTVEGALLYSDKVIVVDDKSRDRTIEILEEIKSDKLIKIMHPINLGQGAALETGNQYALKNGADIIVHFDADGQFLASDIKKMSDKIIIEGYDVVLGSRFMEIESEIPKVKKHIIMPLAKIFNYLFFKIKTSDPQNGFRAMNRRSAEIIEIENNRMAHCTEILIKIFKYKLKVKEVPIKVLYNEFGQSFSGGINIILDLLYKKITK